MGRSGQVFFAIPRILHSTVGTIFALLAGIALVALGTLLVATQAPDGTRDLQAYETAARCPAAPSVPVECRWTQEFTVSGVRLATITERESARVFLTDADGARWKTYYSSDGPVLDRLDEGDRVTGTVWRGRLAEIAAGGASQETHEAPDDMRTRALIGALIAVPPGLLMTAACAWRLCRRAAPAPTPGMVATLVLAFGLFCGGLFSPLVLGGGAESFWMMAAVWFPMAAVLTTVALLYVTVTRKRALDNAAG